MLLSGSLRHGSTYSAVLRTACEVAPEGVEAVVWEGLGSLPHYNPDHDVDPLNEAVAGFRAEIHRAHAIVCAPEYAGALPASFKNALDWKIYHCTTAAADAS
jgi:NAD(P)H-dependent FMN reductase